MAKQEIIQKYKGKIIGRDNLNRAIFVDRIANENGLKHFLYNVYGPQDVSPTMVGLDFLDEYYGLNRIFEIIMEEKNAGVDYAFTTKSEVADWLRKYESFE